MADSTICNTAESAHRHYLDWLRNFIVFWLIPFHTARIFDVWQPYYVKNSQLSPGLTLFFGFFVLWGMELLFVVSGAAGWYAIEQHGARAYRSERRYRLLIPFLFGVLVLVPPMEYLSWIERTGQTDFLTFCRQFFRASTFGDNYNGRMNPGHLWFILYLFGFTLISRPIVSALRRPPGRRLVQRLAGPLSRPGMLLILAVPLALTSFGATPTGHSPLYYFSFYLVGYLLVMDPRLETAINRALPFALPLGLIGIAPALWAFGQLQLHLARPELAIGLEIGLTSFTWCWILIALGIAQRYANRDHALLHYAHEAAYPYYMLHEPLVVASGFFVARLPLSMSTKAMLICALAFAATFGFYELLVRHIGVLRFLFGMKPLQTPVVAPGLPSPQH